MKVMYAIYKKKTTKIGRIAIIYEEFWSHRRSSAMYAFNIICSRQSTQHEDIDIEKQQSNRRYYVVYYDSIKGLIEDDAHYGVETPREFVEYCEKYKDTDYLPLSSKKVIVEK